jgi:signal peptidase I
VPLSGSAPTSDAREPKNERPAIQHPAELSESAPLAEAREPEPVEPPATVESPERPDQSHAFEHRSDTSESDGSEATGEAVERPVPFLPSEASEAANESRPFQHRPDDTADGSTPLHISMAAAADVPLHAYGGPTNPIDGGTIALPAPGNRLAQVKEELVAWLKTLVSAAVYAVLIVTFGFQVARVEGQSMAPTLEDQDRLIVNKLVYRIGEPRRGDIVMLYYPLNPEKSFVKRVIAEEADTVRIVDGRVYVNDIPLKDDYVPSEYRSHDDWGPQVIPEGYYFVMGDHRNNSSDSRHWGMVPKKYIIGKVQLRWWPVPSARVF